MNNKRLLAEAQKAVMSAYTRRHFLKESAMGFWRVGIGVFIKWLWRNRCRCSR